MDIAVIGSNMVDLITYTNHKQPNRINTENSAAYTLFISKGRSYSMVMKTMFTNAKMLFL